MFDLTNIKDEVSKDLQENIGLTKKDLDKLQKNIGIVMHSHKYSQIFRTDTEARISVLNDVKYPTPDSKYWQAIRELKVQSNELFMLNFDYKEKLLDKEEIEEALKKKSKFKINKKRNEIKLEKINYELLQLELTAKDRIREISMWSKIIKELEPMMLSSKKDVNEHQLLSYGARFVNEYITALQTKANISPSEARNLMGLLTTTIKKIQDEGKINQFLKQSPPQIKQFIEQNNLLKIGQTK